MKLVVDTNIVFSALLNSESRIAQILIGGKRRFSFYSCLFLREELSRHRPKIRKLTKLAEVELDELLAKVTGNITFIDEAVISAKLILETEKRMAGNDPQGCSFRCIGGQAAG